MPLLRPGIRKLLRLGGHGAADVLRDVEDEARLHIELRAAQLVREGWSAEAALAEARRLFAPDEETMRALYSSAQERNQRMRLQERWESLAQDARYAARSLARDPLLAVFIIVTLALGVGANVTAFSLVDRMLVRGPAQVRDPENILRLYSRLTGTSSGDQTSSWIPFPNYTHLSAETKSFAAVGAYRVTEGLVGRGQDAHKVRRGQTIGAFFQLLGAQPLHGRFFSADEDAATGGALAVLSEQLWREQFGGSASAIGQTIIVDDAPHTIVGVARAGFAGTEIRRVDVWVLADTRIAGTMNWNILGRLRPGSTIVSASVDAQSVHARTSADGPKWMRPATIFAAPIKYNDQGREPLESVMARWLAVVSMIILLITLANVVNLLLVRLARHRRELAIRVALGSGRARVMRLLAFEGLLLACASGIASLLVARFVEPVVRRALFADEAAWSFSLVDARVLLALLGIVLVTALIVGVVPALQVGNPKLTAALRSGVQGGASGNSRTRALLTIAQAALSVVLLVGAGLFLRSLMQVRGLDLGVAAQEVITVTAELPRPEPQVERIRDAVAVERDVYRRLVQTVRTLPGVAHAAIAVGLPLDGGSFSASVWVDGQDSIPALPFNGPYASVVSAEYFTTVGTPLVQGRVFTERDREGSEQVIIVGQTMARVLWPNRDPLNQCVHISKVSAPCTRVVGVVADVHRIGLREEPNLQYYLPLGQTGMFGGAALVVRPDARAPVSALALREALLREDPSIRALNIELLADRLYGEMRPLRLGLVTFGLSGALALIVALLGLYSLMAYMVAWRTREIGVRVALGANTSQISRLVVGSGAGLAAIGIVIGLAISYAGARLLESQLFQTSAFDPGVRVGVAAALLLVALLAGWIPARRAVRISPTEALRTE